MTECFYVVTEFEMVERFYVATEYFISQQSVTKVERFCVATRKLCCDMVGQVGRTSIATELAKVRRN